MNGADGVAALTAAAIANLVVFLVAFRSFVRFVIDMVDARQEAEDAFFAGIDPETGEV